MFQYVRSVYATAINFPCIITLGNPSIQTEFTKNIRIARKAWWNLNSSYKPQENICKITTLHNLITAQRRIPYKILSENVDGLI